MLINAIDLFCGCGGMSYGIVKSGIQVIGAVDCWDKAVASYNQNFKHKAYCHELSELSPSKFEKLYNPSHKVIDLIFGGVPCQPFSFAGKRQINDERDFLFMEFVSYLRYFKPKMFIMENVIGILSKKHEDGRLIIDIIMSELNKTHNCIITKLYASDFEVPQNRRRVIVIGIRKDLDMIPDEPIKIISNLKDRIPVSKVLDKRKDVDEKLYLTEGLIKYIDDKRQTSLKKGVTFGARFLCPNKPSYTITANYYKDGFNALVKYDEKNIRRLSIAELKRIQTFPDDYVICGNKKEIITQIGNAVPCQFAYHLGKYVINTLQKLVKKKTRKKMKRSFKKTLKK